MPLALAFRIETHASLPSTQALVRARVDAGENVHGLVVRAAMQTAGGGTRGRAWLSPPGGSYQTLAVRDSDPRRLRVGVSAVAAATGIAEVLSRAGAPVRVKWPNDLFFGERKLGGVLSEYRRDHLLLGVGVNVANGAPEGASALAGWDLEGVHMAVLEGVQAGLDAVWEGEEEDLRRRFAAVDLLRGRRTRVGVGEGVIADGVADGIDARGCLRLRTGRRVTVVCRGTVLDFAAPRHGPGRGIA